MRVDFLKRLFTKKSLNNEGLKDKTFESAQSYEIKSSIEFMESPFFKNLFNDLNKGLLSSSKGFINPLILKEFFNDSIDEWNSFLCWINGKRCLDIGPCVMSPLSAWDGPSEKIIIEPLFNQINNWQKNNFGSSAFSGMTCYPLPGEVPIEELNDKIDGVIYCRNMIDHTPSWPFVLANISAYAMKGCRLMLWTDLFHNGSADDGHYDITTNPSLFKKLITQLGFEIIRDYNNIDRNSINYGFFAIKQ